MAEAPKTIRSTGATAEKAVANLEVERETQVAKAQEKIEARGPAYDAKTDNGRNQAAVGGTDTDLKCP